MFLSSGVQLTGSGVYNLFGPVSLTTALSQSTTMVLSSNGSTSAGSLTGPGSLSDGGEFDWNGGTIGLTGSGGATFLANADLKLQGSDTKTVSAGTLTNECNGSEIGGTGTLIIDPGATWDNLGNPNCDVTIASILARGSFINDANGFFDAKGTTTVSGSFSNVGTLEVASASSLTLSSGGAPSATLDGLLQLDGTLTLLGTILSPTGFDQLAGGGTLQVGNGNATGTLSIGSGHEALLSGNVEVTSTGTLGGAGEVNNNGLLKLDVGSTTSLGSYLQSSIGTLELQAAGPGVWSSLTVNGAAQLSGTLKYDFLNGYTPSSGTTLPVLSAASVSAHFDTTPDKMTINYGSNGVTATEN